MKRILCILNGPETGTSISGGDRHALEVWEAWGRSGADITVICSKDAQDLIENFGYRLSTLPIERVSSAVGPFRLGYITRLFRAIAVALRVSCDADLIYSSSAYFYDILPALLLWRLHRHAGFVFAVFHLIPPPWKRHGNVVLNAAAWIEQSVMLRLARDAHTVIVDNDALVTQLSKKGFSRTQILVSQMGVRAFPQVPAVPHSDAIYVGRFSHPKGVPTLLKAWQLVTARNASLVLTLVGRDQDGFSVRDLVRDMGLERNVRICSGLPDELVRAYVVASKIFVTASIEEGYGLSVLEALSEGIACATFDIEAFRLVFPHGRLAAKDFTPESLADAIIRLLGDEDLRRALGDDGRNSVAERKWPNVAQHMWGRIFCSKA